MGYVQLHELSKTFVLRRAGSHRSVLRAVDRVSFEIPRGRTFGLVGENGSGKRTIAAMIVGLLQPDGGEITVGDKSFAGSRDKAQRDYLQQLSIVFQNPYASLDPKMDILHIISEPLRSFQKFPESQIEQRVGELLQTVGLSTEHMRRYAHEFSGGQRQRIAIARALAFNPSLLIQDEPTSALDVSVQAKIINLLTRLRAEHGLTYLFIPHNMGVVRHISNIIGVMYDGRLLEQGDSEKVITSPAHPYTQYLIAAIPRLGSLQAEPPPPIAGNGAGVGSGCPFLARCPRRMPECTAVFPNPAHLAHDHSVYCNLYH